MEQDWCLAVLLPVPTHFILIFLSQQHPEIPSGLPSNAFTSKVALTFDGHQSDFHYPPASEASREVANIFASK